MRHQVKSLCSESRSLSWEPGFGPRRSGSGARALNCATRCPVSGGQREMLPGDGLPEVELAEHWREEPGSKPPDFGLERGPHHFAAPPSGTWPQSSDSGLPARPTPSVQPAHRMGGPPPPQLTARTLNPRGRPGTRACLWVPSCSLEARAPCFGATAAWESGPLTRRSLCGSLKAGQVEGG